MHDTKYLLVFVVRCKTKKNRYSESQKILSPRSFHFSDKNDVKFLFLVIKNKKKTKKDFQKN